MKKIALILAAALLLAGCTGTQSSESSDSSLVIIGSDESSGSESVTESEPENSEPPAPVTHTVTFCAVGDNIIHSTIYQQAKTEDGYDFTNAYREVVDDIAAPDIAIINQETLICNDAYPPSNYPRFNTPVALGDYMIDIGFDVFTIANNHCLDYGTEGLGHALDYWDSRDVVMAGAYREGDDRIRLNECNGITFSYLSYTDNLNGLRLPEGAKFTIGNANDTEEMIRDIKAAREVSDVCIVALHWGVEDSAVVTDGQRALARKLSDAGADIIIGNSPHVLRDIEVIEGEERTTLCAYSLGNFISAMLGGANMIGGILNFTVSLTDGETRPVISDVRLVPTVTHYEAGRKDLHIVKLKDYTPEMAKRHGVKEWSTFNYDFVVNFLKNTVDERYLEMP